MRRIFTLTLLLSVIKITAQTYFVDTLTTGLVCPVAFDFAPDGRIFLTQKGGTSAAAVNAKIKVYDAAGNFLNDFYDLSDSTDADFERGLLGIAVDPQYDSNHYVYVYYVHRWNGDEHIRIARFTDVNNTGTNPFIVFDYDVADNLPGNHLGGNLHFRPAEPDKIYFTIGDLGYYQTDSVNNYAHKLNVPFGKTLRINKDGTIPTDNPFYDDGNLFTGNCDIIWSYGHRNPFDFCFSPVNDSFYCSENGLITWDEVNVIHAGKFYGWAKCEGFYENSSTTVLCPDTTSILPIQTWGAPLPAVTGILFYSGNVMPEFDNHLLVANNDYGYINDLTLGNAPFYDTVTNFTQWIDLTVNTGGLTTLKEGSDGCVYAMEGGYTPNGGVYRVCPSWMSVEEQTLPVNVSGPNPFETSTTVAYTLREGGPVKITLCDIWGRQITIFSEEDVSPGTHSITIDAAALGLAPGNYFCIFEAPSGYKAIPLSYAGN